ncbi:MAG TPA: tetratricopeptide repeat protein [Candidatus Eisenbacteria bacterium]|nr:tetratricopeptide repeat protein [Candidatus Eisenbacteria bacterium]
MTRGEARRLLRDVRRGGSVWWTAKDARFFFGPLKDALRTLDQRGASRADRRLVAAGYAFKGDVSDWTMTAPRAAARAYRAATRRDPRDAWSWQELANTLADVGEYDAAGRALGKARSVQPADDGIDWLSEEIRERGEPYCVNGRIGPHPAPSWDACELLASNRPRDALRLLQGKRDVFLRKLRARAHGALGDADRVVEEWEGIARTKAELELEPGDWFFLPEAVWDRPRFWRALYAMRHRLGYGWSYSHPAIDRIIPHPKRRRDSLADRNRNRRQLALWFL